MNNLLKIVYPDFPIQPRHILARLRELTRDDTLENLIPFDSLLDRYQISATVLWECSLALKIKPQKLNGQIYFTAQNLKRLEQFIKRIEISWACPNVLATCCRAKRKKENPNPCSYSEMNINVPV